MKSLIYLSYLTIILALVSIWIAGYWLISPVKTIEFKQKVFPVLNENKTVQSGGYLEIEIDYCKYTNEIPRITRHFIDSVVYTLPEVEAVAKGKGCGKDKVLIYVPKVLVPANNYVYEQTFHYKPNPLKEVSITINSEPFTISK